MPARNGADFIVVDNTLTLALTVLSEAIPNLIVQFFPTCQLRLSLPTQFHFWPKLHRIVLVELSSFLGIFWLW